MQTNEGGNAQNMHCLFLSVLKRTLIYVYKRKRHNLRAKSVSKNVNVRIRHIFNCEEDVIVFACGQK